MNDIQLTNVPGAVQMGMMNAQKIQATQDDHASTQINQQLKLAQIADENYKQHVMKTTALGEDAYQQGLDSDAWKNFKANNPGVAGQLRDSHAMMDSKKALLQLSLIKAHGTAVAQMLLPIRTIADYNNNYDSISQMMGDSSVAPGLKAPLPTSFKTDQQVSDWVDEMNGKTVHGIKAASASGKFVSDRIEFIQKYGADSPEVKQLDADHQAYLDNQRKAHEPKPSLTGTIPPSASKALAAQIDKTYGDKLSAEDKQAMVGATGPLYMKYIHTGMQPDAAMAQALEDAKGGLATEQHWIGSDTAHFDPTKVITTNGAPASSKSSLKVGDMTSVGKITSVKDGKYYVKDKSGKEREVVIH